MSATTRPKLPPLRLLGRAGRLLPALLLSALLAAPAAMAQFSGEVEGAAGIHAASGSACQTLRTASGVQGDLYLACNAAAPPGAVPCNLIYEVNGTESVIRGDTYGFCADRFQNRNVRALGPDATILEMGKTLRGSVFGSNIQIRRNAQGSDVFCTTFSGSDSVGPGVTQGTRVCVEVAPPGSSTTTFDNPPSCAATGGPALPVVYGGAACATITQQLTSLTGGSSAAFSHALFAKVLSGLGGANSQALFVCNGYRARCADETGATAINTNYPFGLYETPGCGMTRSGYRCW
jgi:hypothetical protein